jgi:hypothetical protein
MRHMTVTKMLMVYQKLRDTGARSTGHTWPQLAAVPGTQVKNVQRANCLLCTCQTPCCTGSSEGLLWKSRAADTGTEPHVLSQGCRLGAMGPRLACTVLIAAACLTFVTPGDASHAVVSGAHPGVDDSSPANSSLRLPAVAPAWLADSLSTGSTSVLAALEADHVAPWLSESGAGGLLPLTQRKLAMFGIVALTLLLAASGGIGGGAVFVPLFIVMGGGWRLLSLPTLHLAALMKPHSLPSSSTPAVHLLCAPTPSLPAVAVAV